MNKPRLMVALFVAVTAALMSVAATTAHGATRVSSGMSTAVLSLFSDPEDAVAQGVSQEFDATNATFSGTLSTTHINLQILGGSGPSNDAIIDFYLAAAPGATLETGYYGDVNDGSPNGPSLSIAGNLGCSSLGDSFDIRDLASTGTTITRLDVLYEQHCEGVPAAAFGELRIGEPDSAAPIISSTSISWPESPLDADTIGAPIWIRNTSTTPLSVGKVALLGPSAAEFTILDDGCTQKTLPAHGSCTVSVRFRGMHAGPSTAALAIPVGDTVFPVQLDGDVPAGTTSLTLDSQPGDPLANGQQFSFDAKDSHFTFLASATGLTLSLRANDGQYWTVEMFPADGNTLYPGTYANATSANGNGNMLDVYGDGVGCNVTGSFTIKQIDFSPDNGSLQHLSASFVQHCDGAVPALTGTVDFDAEADTTPPPAVFQLSYFDIGATTELQWVNPSSGSEYTVVRLEESSPIGVAPDAGVGVYQGTSTHVTILGLQPGVRYTATAFTVDKHGNVSAPLSIFVRGPAT